MNWKKETNFSKPAVLTSEYTGPDGRAIYKGMDLLTPPNDNTGRGQVPELARSN